jgi:hypothetical protein
MLRSRVGAAAVTRLRVHYQETVRRMAEVLARAPTPLGRETRAEAMVAFEEACRAQVRSKADAGLILAFTRAPVSVGDPFRSDLRDVAGAALAHDAARVAGVRWFLRELAETDEAWPELSREPSARAR